ncbi:MAG TPA: hypothetical protein VLB44_04390, partial [Kofleriaceae bacterium]|nr:hypothetical protein [Kofleriaceae bacterium]
QLETGEKLGELLVREGVVTAAKVAEELYAPREEYRSVSADDVDILALKLMGYGLASFYEIVPIETPRGVLLACPYPIHPEVTEDIAHRVGQPVTPVLAAGLEVRVALCIASHSTWPDGVCLRVPGFAGAEVSALLDDPMLVAEAAAAARAATELGVSPIDYLERLGRIGHDQAALLRARALGLPPETSRGRDPGALLPPELIDELGIRVMDVDPRGVILAAPQPTPQLAMRVAQLFIERAVAWRVLVAPGMAVAFKEAV